MVRFSIIIQKFGSQGEKTGWTYFEVAPEIVAQLKPGHSTSFRVKGKLDDYSFASVALLPMGGGRFIMPLKADVRKAIGKKNGALLQVILEADDTPFELCPELMECLADEPVALATFNKQPGSHQKYFSNWINSAKTEPTKAKRIAQTITAMLKKQDYGTMIRSLKTEDLK